MKLNDIDKLFRDKLGHKRVDFDEQSWRDMEKLLNKRERRRRLFSWLFILPFLVALSAGGYYAFQSTLFEGNGSTVKENKPVSSADTSPSDRLKNQQKAANPLERAEKSDQTAKPTKDKSKPSERANDVEQLKNKPVQEKAQSSRPMAAETINDEPGKNNDGETTQDRTKVNSDNNQSQKAEKSSKENTQPAIAGVVKLSKLPSIPGKLNAFSLKPKEASLLEDSLNISDPSIPEPFEIGLAGGLQLSRKNAGDAFQNFSTQPVLGAYVRWHLFNNLYVNSELFYLYDPSPDYKRTVIRRTYDFGYKEEATTLDLESIHYLQVPVYLDYGIVGSHGITAGIKGKWLMNAKGQLTTTNSSSLTGEKSTAHKAWIRPEGLKSFQYEAILGYRYDYNNRLRFQLRGLFGLQPVKREKERSLGDNYHNSGIQLILQYQLN